MADCSRWAVAFGDQHTTIMSGKVNHHLVCSIDQSLPRNLTMPRRTDRSIYLPLVLAGLVPVLGSAAPSVCAEPPRVSCAAPEFGVVVEKNVMVSMRDGVHLAADIYRPARDGKSVSGRFPTLLTRTPYNKDGAGSRGPLLRRAGLRRRRQRRSGPIRQRGDLAVDRRRS